MSTIAFSNTHIAAASVAGADKSKSFWRKIYDRMIEAQHERAQRSVAAYLASHGNLLSDDVEREIMARFGNSAHRR